MNLYDSFIASIVAECAGVCQYGRELKVGDGPHVGCEEAPTTRVHLRLDGDRHYVALCDEHVAVLREMECPIPFPGNDPAERLPDGGWSVRDDVSAYNAGLPPLPADGGQNCHAFREYACTDHLPGWHVAGGNERVFEVWPGAAEEATR